MIFKRTLVMVAFLLLMILLPVITQAQLPDPPTIGPCQVFPDDNPWNTDVSDPIKYPVHPKSDAYIANINAHGGKTVHPDFGETPTYGIPWTTVTNSQPLVPVSFYYDEDSDPGPYPIPPTAPVEDGDDHHVLVVNTDSCILYEMFDATFDGSPNNSWSAGSGAIFDLNSNALRPEGLTSADAAGLPILPGLARCDEVMAGEINHALRFTVDSTQRAYVYPARHYASDITDPNYPPMGLRLRLKANYDISDLTGQALVIAQALKKYGMLLADNGSNWYISGETNPGCWIDDELNELKDIPGTAFEVVGPGPDAAPIRNFNVTPSVNVTWTPITWAVNYRIQMSTNVSFTSGVVVNQELHSTNAHFTTPSLTRGIYYWRVQAQNSAGTWGAWSSSDSVAIDP